MSPAIAGMKLTYDDLLLFPEDGKRHELIDGEHYVSPSPVMAHQQIAGNLHWLLRSYLESHPLGRVFFAPLDVFFSQFDVVVPDLLYLSHERAAQALTDKYVEQCPELVIEIGSPSTRSRDETIKLRLYEGAGVTEYWLVDPRTQVVRVYRRADETFAKPMEFAKAAGAVITSPLFLGLSISVADVFKDAPAPPPRRRG